MISALQDLARGLKSPNGLAVLSKELLKITVEASLNAEMEAHLGNSRNGYNRKTLKSNHGELEIATSHDRNGKL
jgi:transposase-like protein